ncbi:MAG: hypothetical protein P3W87_005065 [Gammaproteobacteria bacterium]|nr:hypothetical protein [Gammaproteobacteria bacterium]
MSDDTLLQHLSGLLGREAVIEGRRLCVIEILRAGPLLVLRELGNPILQDNLYGQPRRRAPRHFQVPLVSELGDRLHPVARQFMSEEEAEALGRRLISRTD